MLLCERRQLEDEKLLLSTQVESGCEVSLGISCPRACVSAVQCFLHGVCQRRAKREGAPRAHRRTGRQSLVTHTHTDSLTHPPTHTHSLTTHSLTCTPNRSCEEAQKDYETARQKVLIPPSLFHTHTRTLSLSTIAATRPSGDARRHPAGNSILCSHPLQEPPRL